MRYGLDRQLFLAVVSPCSGTYCCCAWSGQLARPTVDFDLLVDFVCPRLKGVHFPAGPAGLTLSATQMVPPRRLMEAPRVVGPGQARHDPEVAGTLAITSLVMAYSQGVLRMDPSGKHMESS